MFKGGSICLHQEYYSKIFISQIYANDILLTRINFYDISWVKSNLQIIFVLKKMEKPNYFLGIELVYHPDKMILSQHKYVSDLILETRLWDYNKRYTHSNQR